VELSFETEELRDVCERRTAAISLFGNQAARDFERCLADISAVASVAEFDALFPGSIDENFTSEVRVIEFAKGHKIAFRPGHVKVPMLNGSVDWEKVTRIRILAVETEHD